MLKRNCWAIIVLVITFCLVPTSCYVVGDKIGVLFVIHGGQDTSEAQFMWDATVQQFVYDPNHSVYKYVIWNPALWSEVLHAEVAAKYLRKFDKGWAKFTECHPESFRDGMSLNILNTPEHLETFPERDEALKIQLVNKLTESVLQKDIDDLPDTCNVLVCFQELYIP